MVQDWIVHNALHELNTKYLSLFLNWTYINGTYNYDKIARLAIYFKIQNLRITSMIGE